METTINNQEKENRKASGLRKAVAVAGVCLAAWGLWEVVSLFIDYKGSETTDDAQVEQYLSPVNVRVPVRIDLTDISDEDNARLAAGMMCVVKSIKE